MSLVDELLRSKYSGIKFYCHNLGGFDIVFIVNTIYSFNASVQYVVNENASESKKDLFYDISYILRDGKIIKIQISKGKNSFILLDSYAMLPQSLADLGKSLDVPTIK